MSANERTRSKLARVTKTVAIRVASADRYSGNFVEQHGENGEVSKHHFAKFESRWAEDNEMADSDNDQQTKTFREFFTTVSPFLGRSIPCLDNNEIFSYSTIRWANYVLINVFGILELIHFVEERSAASINVLHITLEHPKKSRKFSPRIKPLWLPLDQFKKNKHFSLKIICKF